MNVEAVLMLWNVLMALIMFAGMICAQLCSETGDRMVGKTGCVLSI